MLLNFKKYLVIAAHPDDEILGCGGLLIKLSKLKKKIRIVYLAEGVSTRFPGQEFSKRSLIHKKKRENACKSICKSLKIKDIIFSDNLCTRLDEYPLINFTRKIEKHIDQFEPEIVLTHNPSDLNIDHQVAYKSVENATRPYRKNFLKCVASFEVPCSTNFTFKKKFNPNIYIDISMEINKKISLFKKYKNEVRKFPFPRSEKGIKAMSEYRGIQSGINNAEAYKIERLILRK